MARDPVGKGSGWAAFHRRLRFHFDTAYSVVRVLAIVVGGLWAVNEYLEAKTESRIKETLTYVERFDVPRMFEARKAVDRVWLSKKDEIVDLLVTKKDIAAWPGYVNRMVSENDLTLPVLTVLDFYDSLAICIEKRICDGETARAFFERKMTVFYNQHMHYFAAMRRDLNDPDFAARVERRVKTYAH